MFVLLFPGRRQLGLGFVVASESVDTALDQNQTKLGISVLIII